MGRRDGSWDLGEACDRYEAAVKERDEYDAKRDERFRVFLALITGQCAEVSIDVAAARANRAHDEFEQIEAQLRPKLAVEAGPWNREGGCTIRDLSDGRSLVVERSRGKESRRWIWEVRNVDEADENPGGEERTRQAAMDAASKAAGVPSVSP